MPVVAKQSSEKSLMGDLTHASSALCTLHFNSSHRVHTDDREKLLRSGLEWHVGQRTTLWPSVLKNELINFTLIPLLCQKKQQPVLFQVFWTLYCAHLCPAEMETANPEKKQER